jgi:hypothetical protein
LKELPAFFGMHRKPQCRNQFMLINGGHSSTSLFKLPP